MASKNIEQVAQSIDERIEAAKSDRLRTFGRTREEAASEFALALELQVSGESGLNYCAVSPIEPDAGETWIATMPVKDGFQAMLESELDENVKEAIEVEKLVEAEQAGKTDGLPKEETKMETKPETKADIARGRLVQIPEGGELRAINGTLVIGRAEDGNFVWKDRSRSDADTLTFDQAIKRLTDRYKLEILRDRDRFAVFTSHAEGEDAQDKHDDEVRERVNSTRTAVANGDNRRREGRKSTSTKASKPVPEGYELRKGADIKVGDVLIADPKRGPEALVEVTQVTENERPYLRIVLGSLDGESQRKKGLSPTRQYPVSTTDKRIVAVEKD